MTSNTGTALRRGRGKGRNVRELRICARGIPFSRKKEPMTSIPTPLLGTAPDISREELLARRRDPGLLVVDVLPRESFLDSHLPGAVSLPVADLPGLARAVLGDPADTSHEIALYCASPT